MTPSPSQPDRTGPPTSIALSVCTHRRNEELGRLLSSVAVAADRVAADVGVVVVDDNPDGRARSVAAAFEDRFPLGVAYLHSGHQNISRARNLGLEAAVRLAEWVAMTDDDVVVPDDWFHQLVALQERTGADAVTGAMVSRFPEGSPAWLTEQPFAGLGNLHGIDGAIADTGATHNSLVRSAWLLDHPEIRFEDDLGELGGEDMVFFRTAIAAGLRIHYAAAAVVCQHEPPERSTFPYQLRRALWLGNSEFVTNRRTGAAGRTRLFLRGGRRAARALVSAGGRLRRSEPVQLRFTVAGLAHGAGLMLGAFGVEVRHG